MRYWIFFILLVFVTFHLWQQSLQVIPIELENKPVRVEGEIIGDPVKREKSVRFVLDTMQFGKLQLDWYQDAPVLQKGQRWDLEVRLKNPRNFRNPGSFDYEHYLFLKQIVATGYVNTRSDTVLLFSPDEKISIRKQIANQIDEILEYRPSAGLIKGLAVGIRDTMTDDQWEVLQHTGTSHLLAISGLHIGLVSGLFFMLSSYFSAKIPILILSVPAPIVGAISAIIGAFIYAALAGFAIPTQRAFIMILIVMLCMILRYQFKSRDILLLAAVIVIFIDPFAVMSASFWLSFGAVAILFAIALQKESRWFRFFSIQWYVSLGLMPFVIGYFQQISWISPFANLIAIPWASFTVVPLTLLGVAGGFIHEKIASFFYLLAESAINYLWWFLSLMGDIPFAWQNYQITDWRNWCALGMGIFLLMLPRGFPGKYLGVIVIASLFFIQKPKPEIGEVWFTVLDVGQGLASVVQTQNHVLVYDTGIPDSVVLSFLKYQGIRQIDLLVLSHDNIDHTGAAGHLKDNMPVIKVQSGEPIKQFDNIDRCRRGDHFIWDDIKFEFLYPDENHILEGNDSSCVLKVSAGDNSILLTGDIEKAGESYLIQDQKNKLPSNILVAPHHGSRTSSTLPFVQAVMPEHVIFATGYLNRFQFPKKEIVERYAARGAKIYDTAKDGAVMFKMSAKHIQH